MARIRRSRHARRSRGGQARVAIEVRQAYRHYDQTIAGILANGGPIDGIGIQGHVNARLTPMERAGAIPDRFARLGRDLRITEFDIPDKSRNDGRKSAVNQ